MERYTALVMLLVITFGAAFLLGAVNVRHDWHGSVYYFSGTSNSLQNTSNNYTSAGAYTAYGVTAPNGKDYSSSIKVSPGYSNGTVYYSNSGAQAAASFPPAVEYYIPIRLDNAQNISTEAPFQQEIYVNSSKYAYLEAGNLSNIEFFYYNGTVINSWLEGSASNIRLNDPQNASRLNTSTDTVYWLNISSGIAADSNLTVYMGFANLSEVLMNGQGTGEAPQLSQVYGRYDNGASVFSMYYNGSGTGNLSLANGGMLSSISMTGPYGFPSNVIQITGNGSTSKSPETVAWSNVPLGYNSFVVEGWGNIGTNLNALFSVRGSSDSSLSNYIIGDGWMGDEAIVAYLSSGANTALCNTGSRQPGWYWIEGIVNGTDLASYIYNRTPEEGGAIVANCTTSSSLIGTQDKYAGIVTWAGLTNPAYFAMIRARAYPPDGVMPHEYIGNASAVPSLSVQLPAYAAYGEVFAIRARASNRNAGVIIKIDGAMVATGNGTVEYGVCSGGSQTCLTPGTYNITVMNPGTGRKVMEQVDVAKGIPHLMVNVDSAGFGAPNATGKIYIPVNPLQRTYSISLHLYSTIEAGNKLGYSWSTFEGSRIAGQGSNTTGNLSEYLNYTNIPVGDNISVYLSSSSSQNYSAEDPNIFVVPVPIVYYVPIEIVNLNNNAMPAPFQQRVAVNGLNYTPWEAPNMQNVMFFYRNGTVINSWLESGRLENGNYIYSYSESGNLNKSWNTTYWIKLPNGLPANSKETVYMGFAYRGTNLLNNITTGENPTLSKSYAEYDDGYNVFNFYSDFRGTTLNTSKWVNNTVNTGYGKILVDNGLTVVKSGKTGAIGNTPEIYSVKKLGQGVLDFFGNFSPSQPQGQWSVFGYMSTFPNPSNGNTNLSVIGGTGLNPEVYGILTWNSVTIHRVTGLAFGGYRLYSIRVAANNTATVNATVNYTGFITSNSGIPAFPLNIGGFAQNSTYEVQWVRLRAYPALSSLVKLYTLNGGTESYISYANSTNSSVEQGSISLRLPTGYKTYIYAAGDGGNNRSAGMGVNWTVEASDSVVSGSTTKGRTTTDYYDNSSVGYSTYNVGNASSPSAAQGFAISGIAINASPSSLTFYTGNGNAAGSYNSVLTYTVATSGSDVYIVASTGNSTFLPVKLPNNRCNSITNSNYSGSSGFAGAWAVECLNQSAGTYSINFTGSGFTTAVPGPAGNAASELAAVEAPSMKSIFNEVGLPSGYKWNVTYDSEIFNGISPGGVGTTTAPGNYLFSIPDRNIGGFLYTPSVSSGYLVAGNTTNVTFTKSAVVVPSGISAYVPINFTDNQTIATPAPFQQMLVVNSSNYSAYEAGNLQNVEFFYGNGTVVPSWLETNDTNSSYHTIYWLRLSASIPSNANSTVFMGWASKATNLFNGNNIGEAPQLSPTYAEYDSGYRVFNFYSDFRGTALNTSKWSETTGTGGSYSVNDGLTIGEKDNYITFVQSLTSFSNPEIVETDVNSNIMTTNYQGAAPFTGVGYSGAGDGISSGYAYWDLFLTNTSANPAYTFAPTWFLANDTTYMDRYPAPIFSLNGILGGVWLATGSEAMYYNYSRVTTWDNTGNKLQPMPIGVEATGVSGGSTNPWYATFQWVRVRAYPPNGVMPRARFGTVVSSSPLTSFREFGLFDNGETWSVTYNGVTESAVVPNNIVFSTAPGSYQFSIPNVSESTILQSAKVQSGTLRAGNTTFASVFSCRSTVSTPSSVPSGIVKYFPLTLCNLQNSSTPAPFQQMLVVNSLNYSLYATSNLNNVEFFNASGSVIPSWMEGNSSNMMQGSNLYTSNDIVYWLKIKNGVPARGSLELFMGFAGNVISSSNNLLNAHLTGEAPQLSPSYGEYDNGANVFALYDNFTGTALNTSKWKEGIGSYGSLSVDNGLTLTEAPTATGKLNYTYVQSLTTISNPSVVEIYAKSTDMNIIADELGPFIGTGAVSGLVDGVNTGYAYNIENLSVNQRPYYILTNSTRYVASNISSETVNGIMGSAWLGTGNERQFFDYHKAIFSTSPAPSISSEPVGVEVEGPDAVGSFSTLFQWVRVRAYPPNDVMPSVTFGAVNVISKPIKATPDPYNLSNTTIDIGQLSVANTIVSGGSGGPYSAEWSWFAPNSSGGNVVNSFKEGSRPVSIAFDPSGKFAYVTNWYYGTVNVIDTSTNNVVDTIDVGSDPNIDGPESVAFNPSGTLAYVVNGYGNAVNVIDVATNSVVNNMPVIAQLSNPVSVAGVAFSPNGQFAYVADAGAAANGTENSLSVINVASNSVVNTIAVGTGPTGIAFSPNGQFAYVADLIEGTVSVVNTASNTVEQTIPAGAHPYSLILNPSGTLAYVTMHNSFGTVNVINVSQGKVVNTIDVGSDPSGIALNPSGTLAYVADENSSYITIIDLENNSVVGNANVGSAPIDVAFSPNGSFAYAITYTAGNAIRFGNLPETALQELPSSGDMQLTVNALVSNSIGFTFGGSSYTENTGSNTVYGNWAIYGFVQDNGTNVYYYGSNTLLMANTLLVKPSLATCTISLNKTKINFGTLVPGGVEATNKGIIDTNTGTAPSYIYVFGSNWIYGSNSFGVSNTVWDAVSGTRYSSANPLTSVPYNTLIDVGAGASNDIYFGVGVPNAQVAGAYGQNITIENSC